MDYKEEMHIKYANFDEIPPEFFLIGLLSEFDNRYQAKADSFFEEISWKQFFAIICINLCEEPPTLRELSDFMGSSHQNVKQILNKLEQKGFLKTMPDEQDKRKQRIVITDKTRKFCAESDTESQRIINRIFQGIERTEVENAIKTIIKMDNNLKGIIIE